jgi:peptidoglycan/xylan/chitin deacetylase (PgdA/CDA1 family)/GH35 family endo-1,4-beta-xylanase
LRSIRLRPLVFFLAAVVASAAEPVKRIALVFDDGPRPDSTEAMLAVLAQEKVTVTFSLIGNRVKENPALARAIAAAGHEIDNHSQTHAQPAGLSDDALDHEVADAQRELTAVLGVPPRWYWPPFLKIDGRVRAAATRAGLAIYEPQHLVVSKDYDTTVPAAEIFRRATTDVRDGTVILFHEWRAETREQLPAILAELRRQHCEFYTFSGLMAALAGSGSPTTPDMAANAPTGGESLLATDPKQGFGAVAEADEGDAFKFSPIDVAGPGFAQAWRIETIRDLNPPWAVEVRARLTRAVKKGDTGWLRFYARMLATADETGSGLVRVAVQKSGSGSAQSLDETVAVGASWQECLLPFTFADDSAPGRAEVSFGFGFKRETLELGRVELVNYGRRVDVAALPTTRFTYPGREPEAQWRRDALARIEQIRKGDFVVHVTDAAGRPVSGARIQIEQRRSAFQWGTALQMRRLVEDTPDNLRYRQVAQEFFNEASTENDLKWPVWVGEWDGSYSRAQTLAGLHWLKDRGFFLRGHVFVWPGKKNLPQAVQALLGTPRQGEIPGMVLDHIRDEARTTRGLLQEWDVLNEPFTNHDLMDVFGRGIMPPWFKVAHEELPGVALFLNDFSNHDAVTSADHVAHFEQTARYLLDQGAPVMGLGLQAHFNDQPNPPERILAVLDRYAAQFHLPVRFTEFDIWAHDEQLQADYTRDFLILAFSHPSVIGVQLWGFWENAHWRPSAAMFRSDWSEKPNAKVYRALVLEQWRTRLSGTTDARGVFAQRGFFGDYVVRVESGGRRVEQNFPLLPAAGAATEVTVVLP